MPAAFGLDANAPGTLEFRAQFPVLDVLEAGQAIGDRTHIAAALYVILAAQRVETAAIAAHVAREQGEIDEGENIVHRVVMLGDAEGPADLRALSPGVSVGGLPDNRGGHAGLTLRARERILLDAIPIGLESARGVLNEAFIDQPGNNDFASHGVGQRDIGTHFEAQPHVRPLGRGRAPRIHNVQPGAIVHTLQYVVEEDRVRLPRIRPPQQDPVRFFNLAVRTRPAARPEDRRQTDDAGGVSSPVATVDIVAPDHRADEFLGNVVQLVGGL